jgi:glucosyl-3-phosphoglycerate synthase
MSFAIIQTVMRRLEKRFGRAVLEDVNRSMKLIRHDNRGYSLDVEEIAERERPPMIELPEYLEHRQTLTKK